MDFSDALPRFQFLAHALEATGGFRPQVSWSHDAAKERMVPKLSGPSYLIRHTRESEEKYAARCALTPYENHLRSACERYVGFLGRRSPTRSGADGPLAALLLADADLRGATLDTFLHAFALHARARGSMLLVIDKMDPAAPVQSLGDQLRMRAVPYLRMARPEALAGYATDLDTGLFSMAQLHDVEEIGGRLEPVVREYTATGWRVLRGEEVIREGLHPFKACPVLAFTESGDTFPVVGAMAQVADLSAAHWNTSSRLDEILGGVTFPLLGMQMPSEAGQQFDPATVSATIGVHSMLVYPGERPGFISPDNGPAEAYMARLDRLQAAISRISYEDVTSQPKGANESGVSRKLRFEALNADLASFSRQMQALEARMWVLFQRAVGTNSQITTAWPTDYNLADLMAELDELAAMQMAGMPAAVLAEKQRAVVRVAFDGAEAKTLARLDAAINEHEQELAKPDPEPGPGPNDPGNQDPPKE